MKKLFLVFILTFAFRLLAAPGMDYLPIPRDEPVMPYEKLWRAVCIVESSNNINALNRKEQAYGIAQIRQIRINDFNKQSGRHYKTKDMFDPMKSREVFNFYCRGLDLEQIARDWNGSGLQTRIYWNKVKKYLKN